MNKTDKLEAALAYAERGWPVIPVRTTGTREIFPRWKQDEDQRPTTDTDEVSRRWSAHLDANPAICVGPRAGVTVLDWDVKNAPARFGEDPDPREMVETVEEELGPLPETLTARTGSGGLHQYFTRPEALDAVSTANLAFRLEGAVEVALGTRESGKLVFAPPTDRRTVKEKHHQPYEWVDADADVAELPEAWVEAILEAAGGEQHGGPRFELPDRIPEGGGPYGGRNETLWRYAGQLWKRGLAPAQLLDALRRANRQRCEPPLDDATLVDQVERTVQGSEPGHTYGYRATPQGLRLLKFKDGEPTGAEVLTNFTAEILRDTTVDDGATRTRELDLRAHHEGRSYDFRLEASEFDEMKWPIAEIGARAVVEPYKKGKAQAAIQHLSPSVERHQVFAHTGWRKVAGSWLYLFHGGAIDAEGLVEDVDVRLPDALTHYRLPAPPEGEALTEAVQASLELLNLLPDRVMVPALAAVATAPLGELQETNFSLYLAGTTGSFKTTLAALLQGFFGTFDASTLPASWSSTANALERLLSAAKDTLLVIDDYAPDGTTRGSRRMQRKADQVLRGAANRQARQRLTSTTEFRETYVQRGLPIVTGEQLPQGESLRARFYAARMRAGEMDTAALSEAQRRRDEGLYRRAIAGYVAWLAPRLDELRETLEADRLETRDRWQADVDETRVHRRSVDLCARLGVGFSTYLDFARDVGVDLSRFTKDAPLGARVLETLKYHALGTRGDAGRQVDYHEEENPGQRFISLLRSALVSGQAYLSNAEPPYEEPALQPTALGWKKLNGSLGGYRTVPGADKVGWIDDEHVYLLPEPAFEVAQQLARGSNLALSGDANSLYRDMKDRGQLSNYAEQRTKKYKRLGDEGRHRVVWISAARLLDVEPDPVSEEHARTMSEDADPLERAG